MKKKSPHDPTVDNPFKRNLQGLKQQLAAAEEKGLEAAKEPAPRPPARRPPEGAPHPDMDARLYAVAMSGVVPLGARGAARVSQRDVEVAARPRSLAPDVREKRRAAEGGATLRPRWDADGTVSAAHRGRGFSLEALGRYATPEASLDLHGLDAAQARIRVADFVRSRRARGLRCVCVITGYGKSSPDGASVLVDAAVSELCAPPTSTELDAFASAPEHLGGRGAILISLRA